MSTSKSASKVFIGVPIHGDGKTGFWLSTLNMMVRPDFHMEIRCNQGDSLVPRSRNELTAQFLKTDCTHLFFVDSDIVYTRENVKALLDHDEEVIAGYYPKRLDSEGIQWCCNEFEEPEKVNTAGKKKMRMMGTGFMLIKRCVFEKILSDMEEEIWFTNDETGERQWDFWPIGIWKYDGGVRRYLSEDWFFCERWRQMGGQVLGDTMTTVRHIGDAEFPLKLQMEPR